MSVSVETIWPHIGDQAYISDIFIFFFSGLDSGCFALEGQCGIMVPASYSFHSSVDSL